MYIQMYYWRIGKVQKSLSSQARQDAVSCGQDNDEEESQIRWVNPEGMSDTHLFSDRVNPAFQRDCAAHSPQKEVGSRKCAASGIEAAIVLPSQATHDVCNTKHSAGVDSHGSTALEAHRNQKHLMLHSSTNSRSHFFCFLIPRFLHQLAIRLYLALGFQSEISITMQMFTRDCFHSYLSIGNCLLKQRISKAGSSWA